MKKIFIIFIVLIASYLPLYADVNTVQCSDCYEDIAFCEPACGTDRTFMFTRPIYRNLEAQLSLWHNVIFNHCNEGNYSLQVMPMYGQSIASSGPTHYFLFHKKDFLNVQGDDATGSSINPYKRDIRAEWLGLPSNFQGSFSVKPSQNQFGLWIETKINLGACFKHDFFHPFWIGIAAPFQIIENKYRIIETPPINPGTSYPHNITEALENPSLQYYKAGPKKRLASVSEICFKFGTNFMDHDGFQIGTYSFFLVPTSKTDNPEFIFSPYLGNNRHFGIGQAVMFQLPLNSDIHCQLVSFFFNIENIYFIRNFQMRTLDLKFRPYSRYLLLVNRDGTRNIPGPSVLTQRVRVRPYNMADMSIGFRYKRNWLEAEFSYNLWMRGEERIKLRHCFPNDFGIQGVGLIPGTSIPATASASTIQEQAPNDVQQNVFGQPPSAPQTFVPITAQDLLLQSAAAKGALNHRAQISLGGNWKFCKTEILAGFGGYVELPQYNSDLDRWGVWAKVGITV